MKNNTKYQLNVHKLREENINTEFKHKINDLENEQRNYSNMIQIKQNEINEIIKQENMSKNKIYQIKKYLSKINSDQNNYFPEKDTLKIKVGDSLQSMKKKLLNMELYLDLIRSCYNMELKKNIELGNKYMELKTVKTQLENDLKMLNETLKKKYWTNSAKLSIAQQIELANQEIISWKYRLQRQSILLNDSRRKLFNIIQDIRGNIRVFCRIKPPKRSEENSCIQYDISEDSSTITIKNTTSRGLTFSTFNFDYIFSPFSTQDEVFEEVSQLIQSVLDGYNVCIFSYGQTGSGKTYTMLGGDNENELGVIPRSTNLIFDVIEKNKEKGWNYQVECFAVEIYNEAIRDLIPNKQRVSEIEFKQSRRTLTGINIIRVNNLNDINNILNIAHKGRVEACTKSNERSSRSHVLVQLKITGKHRQNIKDNTDKLDHVSSTLSLVDLAGSERVDKSGVSGERMRETQFINKSLSALGDVINSIALRKDHVPYRNSKLTMILKDSLGGNSKTAMLVHISPTISSLGETISSLRFASKVQNCDTNRANKKISA